MSNTNNRNQPVTAINRPNATPSDPATAPSVQQQPVTKDPELKSAILLCLNLLLRTATMGQLSRSHETEIKETIDKLKDPAE